MFGFYWQRDQFKLAYIRRLRRRLDRSYRAETKKLEKEGVPAEEIEHRVRSGLKGDYRVIDGESHALWSDQVLRKVRKLGIPLPSQEGENNANWWRPRYLSRWVLTQEGYNLLKPEIREQEKYQREVAAFWLQVSAFWFGVITTLLSLTIAIIALLKQH
jgi:hypothetical protein